MITVTFICPCERITENLVLESYRNYSNFDEIKHLAPANFLFLKDIQENILDKYLDINRYIAAEISDHEIYVDGYDDVGYGKDGYSLNNLVKKHFSELSVEAHKKRVLEALGDGAEETNFLSENLDPLTDCYLIVKKVQVEAILNYKIKE